jgi:hypothetical protein
LRGVASLGELIPEEFIGSFGSRWPTTLGSIQPKDLQNEVYAAVRPDRIAASPSFGARYQRLKLAIWPRRPRSIAWQWVPIEPSVACIEHMPIVF